MKMQKVNIERNKLTADGKFTIHEEAVDIF